MNFVPAPRLLWLVFGAVLAACLAGPLPELTPVWLGALGGVMLVALADAVVTARRGEQPTAEMPLVVRMNKDRPATVPVTFSNPRGRPCRLRFALGLPVTFDSPVGAVWVDLPENAKRARIDWACTARRRGRYRQVLACLEMKSTLGLWWIRTRLVLPGELRVYPNLWAERKQLAALFLAQGGQGAIAQRMVGRGREFEKLRDYQPGDGYDEIHWKATAKRGRPVTKVFQAERTQEIYVILDTSRLSGRPVNHDGIEQTALERCLTAAFVLMLAAERQGDRFGLVAHDDRVRLFLRASRGTTHYGACREAALALQPSGATPDMAEIVRYLKTNLHRRALLFFLTDLTDPVLAEDFVKHVRVLSRQHLILVSQLRAAGLAPLFAGAEVKTEADIYARLAGHARWRESRALAQRLRPLGVTAALLENETMAAQLVTQYLQVKRRQAL
jgi:uncharacterized protein (DUF58 family)